MRSRLFALILPAGLMQKRTTRTAFASCETKASTTAMPKLSRLPAELPESGRAAIGRIDEPASRCVLLHDRPQLPIYQRVNALQLTSSANYVFGVQTKF